jgi:hypothetical protein
VAALLLCQVARVGFNVVAGHTRVRGGELTHAELPALVARQRQLAAALREPH